MRIEPADTVPAVAGVITYLSDGAGAADGLSDAYAVQVYDARSVYRPFSLERNGFELVHWPSATGDFTDPERVRDVYAGEVEDFLTARLRADRAAVVDSRIETAADADHCELTERRIAHVELSGQEAVAEAAEVHARRFPDAPAYRRAVTVVCWRALTPPPQDWPVAFCDYASVPDDDGVRDPTGGEAFPYRPTHRWYFYPDMVRDEAVVFVEHDTDRSRAWRVVHTTFLDAAAVASVARVGVATRAIAYFR